MNIVKFLLLVLALATSGCAQMQKSGLVKYPGQNVGKGSFGRVISSDLYESTHKHETKVVSRGYAWNDQFAPGASSLPPKPRRSTFILDTGRTYIRKETGGHVSHYTGYSYHTGEPVLVTQRSEYSTKVVQKREPYRIPYESLPDRGGHRIKSGYVSGHIQMKPILMAPIGVMPRR